MALCPNAASSWAIAVFCTIPNSSLRNGALASSPLGYLRARLQGLASRGHAAQHLHRTVFHGRGDGAGRRPPALRALPAGGLSGISRTCTQGSPAQGPAARCDRPSIACCMRPESKPGSRRQRRFEASAQTIFPMVTMFIHDEDAAQRRKNPGDNLAGQRPSSAALAARAVMIEAWCVGQTGLTVQVLTPRPTVLVPCGRAIGRRCIRAHRA